MVPRKVHKNCKIKTRNVKNFKLKNEQATLKHNDLILRPFLALKIKLNIDYRTIRKCCSKISCEVKKKKTHLFSQICMKVHHRSFAAFVLICFWLIKDRVTLFQSITTFVSFCIFRSLFPNFHSFEHAEYFTSDQVKICVH